MVVYFSGTGNSRYCADFLAKALGDEVLDAFHFIRDGVAAELLSEKPWVFVCPTYAWRLPRVFRDFIRGGYFSGADDAWFVMTCGSEIGAPEGELRTLCREKRLRFRGVFQVVMPENYIAMFDAPEEAEARAIVAAAREPLMEAAAHIRAGEDFPTRRSTLADRVKSGPVNPFFYRFFVRSDPFWVGESCVGCGACEAACPTAAIRMEKGRPVWGKGCTHCMACITLCPARAIEYGSASVGKPRYRCPAMEEKA